MTTNVYGMSGFSQLATYKRKEIRESFFECPGYDVKFIRCCPDDDVKLI